MTLPFKLRFAVVDDASCVSSMQVHCYDDGKTTFSGTRLLNGWVLSGCADDRLPAMNQDVDQQQRIELPPLNLCGAGVLIWEKKSVSVVIKHLPSDDQSTARLVIPKGAAQKVKGIMLEEPNSQWTPHWVPDGTMTALDVPPGRERIHLWCRLLRHGCWARWETGGLTFVLRLVKLTRTNILTRPLYLPGLSTEIRSLNDLYKVAPANLAGYPPWFCAMKELAEPDAIDAGLTEQDARLQELEHHLVKLRNTAYVCERAAHLQMADAENELGGLRVCLAKQIEEVSVDVRKQKTILLEMVNRATVLQFVDDGRKSLKKPEVTELLTKAFQLRMFPLDRRECEACYSVLLAYALKGYGVVEINL